MSRQEFLHQIQSVVAAVDIVDVVSEHVALKQRGRNFLGLCPFHKEKTPSFNVSPERQIFKCFGCGAGGDVIKFVQRILNIEFKEALEQLARRAGIQLTYERKPGPVSDAPGKSDLYKVNAWATDAYRKCLWNSPTAEAARAYILGRKLSKQSCEKFNLGFSPPDGRGLLEAAGRAGFSPKLLVAAGLAYERGGYSDVFRNRVMFPIYDAAGNVIAFGARTMGDDQPKYLNSPETALFHKSRSLFGIHLARPAIQEAREVVVVEGYTDVIACHQAGVQTVVATLGTALTEEHVMLLRRYADRIVLVFDGDAAGERAADHALAVFLTLGVDVKIATMTGGLDPCDLILSQGPEPFRAVVAGAVEALDYKWQQLRARFDVSTTSRERRIAIDELLKTVAACDPGGKIDAIQRGMVLSRLAGMLSIPVAELGRELQRFRRHLPVHTRDETKPRPAAVLRAPRNAAEAAFRELLEVIVCEPGYIGEIAGTIDPDDFESPYREIGRCLWQAHEAFGEFSLRELLATIEDVELAELVTELHRHGMNRGNFAATVDQALGCIEDHRRSREASQIAASVRDDLDDAELDRQLKMLQHNLMGSNRPTPGAMVD